MAGHGPPPKDPSQRARGNKDPIQGFKIRFEAGKQPQLPRRMPLGLPWPARTRVWWKMWAQSALAESFTANDWSELLDTAVLHGMYWHGDLKAASELRLRVANFGATPADRARLRISFADADEKDARRSPAKPNGAKERYGKLRVVADLTPEAVGE